MAGGFLGVNQRICPECKATIASDVTQCRFCNARFDAFGYALNEDSQTPAPDVATGTLYRHGKLLVTRSETPFPDRCIKTNAPTTKRLKRNLYWHPPVIYLVLLAGVMVYVIVAMVARKKATLQLPLCDDLLAKRSRDIKIAWGLFGLAILSFFLAAVVGPGIAAAGGLFLIGSPIYWLVAGQLVSTQKIENDFVYIAGVCPEFLNTLPEWDGK